MSSTTTSSDASASAYRVNYSDYVSNITNSPKTARKLPTTTGIGHHINPSNNSTSNRPNQAVQHTGTMPHYGGGAEKCARCLKNVYLAEKKVGAGRPFHTSCFNCEKCHRKLDTSTLSEHKGEIYCKPCYTKCFGAHGLITGVSMSTERGTQEVRSSRRSSFGNDLDASTVTYQQTRHRANSSENLLREDYGNSSRNEYSQQNIRRSNAGVEFPSPSIRKSQENIKILDTNVIIPPTPTRLDSVTIEHRFQPIPSLNDDRRSQPSQNTRNSSSSGTSALVDIPVLIESKRGDSTIGHIVRPTTPTKRISQDRSRSPSPSISSNSSYRRQNSHDREIEIADNYSRMTINDNNRSNSPRSLSSGVIATENPLVAQKHFQSSSSTSYESKYRSSPSTTNNYRYDRSGSRDSSPIAAVQSHRSPSPTSGYVSSSTTRTSTSTYREGTQRDSASPSSAFVPRQDYQNIRYSTDSYSNSRRSPSPQRSSAVNDFVIKTNLTGNTSSSNSSKFSALSALARPRVEDNPSDDEFDH